MLTENERYALENTVKMLEMNCGEEFTHMKIKKDWHLSNSQTKSILKKALSLNEVHNQLLQDYQKLSILKKIKYYFRNNTIY